MGRVIWEQVMLMKVTQHDSFVWQPHEQLCGRQHLSGTVNESRQSQLDDSECSARTTNYW